MSTRNASGHGLSGHGHGHGQGQGQGHGHGHHSTTEIDWEVMAAHLERNGELQLPVLSRTAARLRELLGPKREVRRVLDIGSGPGVMTCVLAEVFADAETVAVDGAPGLLDRALARAERLGLGARVATRQAELPDGLDDALGTADLVWSSKAVHHLGDQQGAVDALAGVLRPGGLLAVAEGGLPMRFLPRDIGIGAPGLQARLDAVQEHWFSIMRAELPGSTAVVEDWPAMLARAGLTGVGGFTFLLDLPAPLGGPARAFLHAHLTRLREAMGELLDAEDRTTLDVLIDPEAAEGIGRRPDAFLLSATTVFTGTRPAGAS
ncbi:trans-aconitate 2-methyltransferase [Streptomyces sp. ISL-94]|uniref:class I SAM-dependent methyltransferase n=1 Tax=Streptomyces sp. ISL-94 TaxID=2819190 RepID=UPI001BE6F4DE|nr:class I SAM-dependent methyltransferase [Streptomyces sp. ISL-94]MBT2477419.1 methyltransferase domain-containing protein [Streptomyces sp. ISL-94]